MVLEKYTAQAAPIQAMKDTIVADPVSQSIRAWNRGSTAVTGSAAAGGTASATVARTAASPQWAGETVWNFRQRMALTTMDVGAFESCSTIHG